MKKYDTIVFRNNKSWVRGEWFKAIGMLMVAGGAWMLMSGDRMGLKSGVAYVATNSKISDEITGVYNVIENGCKK